MKSITTTLKKLISAHGMTVADLRKDRRYAHVTGDERIVLEPRGAAGTRLYIVEAPPWLPVDDFGPLGVTQAKRAGFLRKKKTYAKRRKKILGRSTVGRHRSRRS